MVDLLTQDPETGNRFDVNTVHACAPDVSPLAGGAWFLTHPKSRTPEGGEGRGAAAFEALVTAASAVL